MDHARRRWRDVRYGEKADVVFLEVLRRFNAEGRRASDRKGMNFAPRLFARERGGQGGEGWRPAPEKAMRRLDQCGQVSIVLHGLQGGRQDRSLYMMDFDATRDTHRSKPLRRTPCVCVHIAHA